MGPQALAGVRVLDMGTLLAGPFAATLLGDFGAEIIKVEQPGIGDSLRGGRMPDGSAGKSISWLVDSRNKKSVTLNLRVPEGQELLLRLVAEADVVIENFTPGTLERWNLGWEQMQAVNPGLVMMRVSGYGQTGPYSDRPGYDRIALGISGYMYPTGYPDRPPVRPAFPTADYHTATYAAWSVMMALYWRDAQGGTGQMIDLALYEPPFRITSGLLADYTRHGRIRERAGNRNPTFTPAGNFLSRDGRWVQIAAGGDAVWHRLAAAIGRPELATDERYQYSRTRVEHADELEALLEEWCANHDYDEIDATLVAAKVAVGGIMTSAEIVDDPHYRERGSYITVEDPTIGPIPMPAPFPKMSETSGAVNHTGPDLGAHNAEIYTGLLGMTAEEIAALTDAGVI